MTRLAICPVCKTSQKVWGDKFCNHTDNSTLRCSGSRELIPSTSGQKCHLVVCTVEMYKYVYGGQNHQEAIRMAKTETGWLRSMNQPASNFAAAEVSNPPDAHTPSKDSDFVVEKDEK